MERRVVPDDAKPINLDRCYAASDRQMEVSRRTRALLAAAGEDGPERRWYVLRTDARADKAVDKALEEAGIERWMPVKEVRPQRRGGCRKAVPEPYEKPVLPGYVFVRIMDTPRAWAGIRTIKGVRSVLGGAYGPAPVSDDKLLRLKAFLDKDPKAIAVLTNALETGDRVTVIDGPFASFPGIVEAVMGGRSLIEVMIFGRATRVELELAQIKKIG